MNAIVVCFLLAFAVPFAASDAVTDLHNGLISSLFLINQAIQKAPLLSTTLTDLQSGIVNLYYYPVTNANLQQNAAAIAQLAQTAATVITSPIDFEDINVTQALSLISTLKGLLPANSQSFQASVTAHGGIGGLVSTSIPYVQQLFAQFTQN